MNRDAIKEALEKIKEKYIKNETQSAGLVALDKEISLLEIIAKEKLEEDDEILEEIKKTKKIV